MPDFITLTCPSCGGKLKVTDQIHLLACRNCGNEHMVVRDSGTMYLAPLAQDLRGIRVGVDKTAAELAVARLGKEIEQLEANHRSLATKSIDQLSPPGGWEKFFAKSIIPVLGLGFIALITQSFGFALFMGVCFLVAFVGYLVFSNDRSDSATKARKAKLAAIESELSAKYEQYRKNRSIAES